MTVGGRVLQVEASLPQATFPGPVAEAFAVPVALRYGLAPGVEARVSTSLFDATSDAGQSDAGAGFSTLSAGLKLAVPLRAFALARSPEVVIPTDGDRNVGFQFNVPAAFAAGLYGVTLVPNLTTGNGATSTGGAVIVSRSFGTLSAYGEVGAYPVLDADGLTPVLAGAGVAVLVNDDTQPDAFFNAGLTDAAPDLVVGVSVRFD